MFICIFLQFASCSSLTRVSTVSKLNPYRKLASAAPKSKCTNLIESLISKPDQITLNSSIKGKIDSYWDELLNNGGAIIGKKGKFRRWMLNRIQVFNKNPEPVYFIEDMENTFLKIGIIKNYYQNKNIFSDEFVDINEILEHFNKVVLRYRNFPDQLENLMTAHMTLDVQITQLKKLLKRDIYPIKIKMLGFNDSESENLIKTFRSEIKLSERIISLKNQKEKIFGKSYGVFSQGSIVKRQVEQAVDLERLRRLRDVVEDIYDSKIAKNLKLPKEKRESIPYELKALKDSLENTLEKKGSKRFRPHRSYQSKFIGKQLGKELKEMFVIVKENKAIRNISEFYNSMSDEQLRALKLFDKKQRLTNLLGALARNKHVILLTRWASIPSATGAIIYFKDWLLFDEAEKARCIILGSEGFIGCVDEYFKNQYNLEKASAYFLNGEVGLEQALGNDLEKVSEFITESIEWKEARDQFLKNSELQRQADRKTRDMVNPGYDRSVDYNNASDDIDLDLNDLGDIILPGDEFADVQ